jgi:hypothetical protein
MLRGARLSPKAVVTKEDSFNFNTADILLPVRKLPHRPKQRTIAPKTTKPATHNPSISVKESWHREEI